MIPAVADTSPRLVPMAPEAIDKVRRLEANLKEMPQVAIRTEHLIHGGMYARTIRIPVHMVETINKYQQVVRRLVQDLGRDPLPEETAAEMGVEVDKIRHIIKISQDTVSLEAPVGDEDDDSSLANFVPDEDTISPAVSAQRKILKQYITEIVNDLTSREQKILDMRFGLTDGVTHTLEEVGRVFSVTRERIRQIEAKALDKIRQHTNVEKLKNY